jgi:hypothetical protein
MGRKRTKQRDPEFPTLSGAARRAGVGVRHLRRARDEGELRVFQVGARWQRVRWADVVEWIERHEAAR